MNITVSNPNTVKDISRCKNPRKSLSRQQTAKISPSVNFKVNTSQKSQKKPDNIKQLLDNQNPLNCDKQIISNSKEQNYYSSQKKTYIVNSKFIKSKNYLFTSQKVSFDNKKIQHQSLNKTSDQSEFMINNFCATQGQMKHISSSRSPAYVDKHLICKKNQQKNQFTQPYKKFDITELNFSSGFTQPTKVATCITLPTGNQYGSLVSKSRYNIKKIIELNRMLKQNKNCQKVQQQKSQIKNFTDEVQILQKIRTGCFGTVFKAKILQTGKLVAIKSFPYDRKFQQREEQICKIINNPFIVKIHKIFHTTDLETLQKSKNIKVNQKKQFSKDSSKQNKYHLLSKKSLQKIQKQLNHENVKFQSQISDFPSQLQKIINNKQISLKQHIKEFHNITNIVMDLYDCNLNDYIMIKNKTDNLTLKLFCYQMLRSVLYLHSNYICHRDIKPHNFLVKKHLVVLGDFGSAKIMKNNKNSNVSYICSRYYRAPELILGYKFYDKSIDIWSLGAVMAQLALGKPLFTGANSLDQLVRIIRIIGQPDWRKISFMIDKIPKVAQIEAKGIKNIFSPQISPLFVDLLQNMLKFNPLQRVTAGQALSHPFFDQIRDQINFQQICKQMDINHFLKFSRDQLKQNQHLKNKLIPLWFVQTSKFQGTKTNNFLR